MPSLRLCLLVLCASSGFGAPVPPRPAAPAYQGCIDPSATGLPYCDTSLSDASRVADLISRLNITEKIWMISPIITKDAATTCRCQTYPIPRLGIPPYSWLIETNTAVGVPCLGDDKCATTFVGPTAMASSFNRTAWAAKGKVLSTELRVFYAYGHTGLTGFGPNINLLKDPRYGRNSELPGEDPFLSGSYAVAMLSGMQTKDVGPSGRAYPRMLALVKHYTAYNVEQHRFEFSANVSQFEFWDSYLPQFEMAFVQGNADGAMCSYFSTLVDGKPVGSCGNDYLLNQVIRGSKYFNRPEALIESDCSAVGNFIKTGFASSPVDASAKALNGGLDVYGGWGDELWSDGYLAQAISQNFTTEAKLDATLSRVFLAQMRAGRFNPLDDQPVFDASLVNSTEHQAISFDAALQGQVLLKNDGGVLPLKPGLTIAAVGPMVNQQYGLLSDYYAAQQCVDNSFDCMITFADAVTKENVGGVTNVVQGINVTGTDAGQIPDALDVVKSSDIVIVFLGITRNQEHEGIDRADTLLPGLQESFAHQILAAASGKPTILVLSSGGCLSIDSLIAPFSAIVNTFNPNRMGTTAFAQTLFGHSNRWGKLPMTMYPGNYTSQRSPPKTSMSFTTDAGRSYRYYKDTPLFSFGYGLSYTSFDMKCSLDVPPSPLPSNVSLTCLVSNTGSMNGDEVLQVYSVVGDAIRSHVSHPVPLKSLIEFERVYVAAGSTASVTINFPRTALSVTTTDGTKALYSGDYDIVVWRGNGKNVIIPVTAA